MTDYFTKWAEAVPIKNKRKETVAHAIYKEWYCRHGIPYQLQSDQGKEFTNDLLERLNKRMVVDHTVTSPYYPQANGQVERLNRVLVDSLSIYCSEHLATWDEFLPSVLFSYRTAHHAVTGVTPFAMIHHG
jgi:transposase InsO family protein